MLLNWLSNYKHVQTKLPHFLVGQLYKNCYTNNITTSAYTVSQKNAQTLKRYSSKSYTSCTKDSGIEFACFSFRVGLLFINCSSFKLDTENNANFDAI